LFKWFRWLPHICSLPYRIKLYDKVVFLSHKNDWGRFFDARVARLTGARNTAVIPNGVPELPTTISGEFRKKHNIETKSLFLCIANYYRGKNQERALHAFARAALADSTLVFIGSKLDDYGDRMVALWQDLLSNGACGHVIFLEGLGRYETMAALRDCDVKILSSDAETQPIVLLEAMAAAKPFISTRTGCVEELKGGVIVSNEQEMADAMRYLAHSPNERSRLGNEGRQDYEAHYSLEITSKAWIDLLEQL
jgi:glycosyltransferase involved in cell wall biosynthesis